ncbi:MAG TPA: HNH endonuclease [Acidimicrobiales bacterium]|nr:HNH endonuclease [Acidimicrobiales bacterium]
MSKALVLNASYEPLCVVSVRRAVVLVLKEKAEVLHTADRVLHSERTSMPVPSVIRLNYFVKVPFRARAALNRRAVFARDGGRCQYCGAAAENIDHVIPRSRGGQHVWENVVAACRPCNTRKEDRALHEVGFVLRRRPAAPKELTWIIVAVGTVHPHWEPYLQGPALDGAGALSA